MSRLPEWVDEFMPFRGPCAICGGPDARHREVDAMLGAVRAGDPISVVADAYERPYELLARLLEEYPA